MPHHAACGATLIFYGAPHPTGVLLHSPSPAALSLSDGTALLPLVVDLDGTLICTDMLHESALQLFRDEPLTVPPLPAGSAALAA